MNLKLGFLSKLTLYEQLGAGATGALYSKHSKVCSYAMQTPCIIVFLKSKQVSLVWRIGIIGYYNDLLPVIVLYAHPPTWNLAFHHLTSCVAIIIPTPHKCCPMLFGIQPGTNTIKQ